MHPGGIHTELGRQFGEGAATTSVWAATSADVDGYGGAYLEDCGIAEISADAVVPENAEAVWTLSERLVGPS